MHPEKNDVDVARMFNWGKEFTIEDSYGNPITNVFIRLAGDAEINRARVYAIRKSAELRRALTKENTDERIAFIDAVNEFVDKDELIELISMAFIREYSQDATKEVTIAHPKEPKSDASLEEQEKYQAEVDQYETKRFQAVQEYVINKLGILKQSLQKESIEYLRKEYEKVTIKQLCEQEMISRYKDYCVFVSVYVDSDFKIRMFRDINEFENLPTEIKDQYSVNYSSLEINIEELKKLLGATQ